MLLPLTSHARRWFIAGVFTALCSPIAHAEEFLIPAGDIDALQAALDASASNNEADVIDLQGATFTLTEPRPGTQSGLVIVGEAHTDRNDRRDTVIQNGTIERSTAPGTPDFRLIEVNPPAGLDASPDQSTVRFDHMTLQNGRFNAGNVLTSSTGGGAILANWQTSVRNSTVRNNAVIGNGTGGAIRATADLVSWEVQYVENTAVSAFEGTEGRGGAIFIVGRAFFTFSTFERNRADNGGAVYVQANFDDVILFDRSLFTNNSATRLGGGIWSRARRLQIENSTLTGNRAFGGGAVYSQSPGLTTIEVQIRFSTLVGNVATGGSGGGAVLSEANATSGTEFVSSLIGDNRNLNGNIDNCVFFTNALNVEPVTSSIADDRSCDSASGGFMQVDDIYGVVEPGLANNGGPTLTLALVEGSPAIDASLAEDCPPRDQRHSPRYREDITDANVGNACDIGAFEATVLPPPPTDSDEDGIPDEAIDGQMADNCPLLPNPGQEDFDGDGIGDVCDEDRDGDGVPQFDPATGTADNCPDSPNENQIDTDEDGLGDICDNTPDGDDADGDGIGDAIDNCPAVNSTDQTDTDNDGFGNVCDTDDDNDGTLDVEDDYPLDPTRQIADADNDGVRDREDNCPAIANEDQLDTDNDLQGNVCDDDDDNDGILDEEDEFPLDPDRQFTDTDGDGIRDTEDNCPAIANQDQLNTDGDEFGNLCDDDDDNDGVLDEEDDFPLDPDRQFTDTDGDGIRDTADNCPTVINADQTDSNGDGIGDDCEEPTDETGDDVRDSIESVATSLDSLVSESNGLTRRILSRAARYLDAAQRDRNWSSGDELSARFGHQVFNNASLAVNEIERIADARRVDAQLKSQLDALTSTVLDDLRDIAERKIADARQADGSVRRIQWAEWSLQAGDRDRQRDWLRGAARYYGNAWRWARSAY